MKNKTAMTATSMALTLLLAGCDKVDDKAIESSIKAAISENAKAMSQFPKTLDSNSILKIYAANASLIDNGRSVSLEEEKKSLSSYEELVNLGKQINISSQTSNVQVKVFSKDYAQASYDFTLKTDFPAIGIIAESGKCTAILKRENSAWLIESRHCSSEGPSN